jgi:cobalt-zinc-cadmium resistance protein CzcA
MASAVREKLAGGWPLNDALLEGAANTMRAVLTTGAVAALGFLPMALASGAGAEVQRPLATVVIAGILLSTLLTLFLLPGVLRVALFSRRHQAKPVEVRDESGAGAQHA